MKPPIKQGKRWKAGIYTQQALSNIGEMHECITQPFNNPSDKYKQYGLARHNGIDLWYDEGTEVFACHDGVGVYKENDITGYGNFYRVTGDGFQTSYGHLKSGTPSRMVKAGDLIGYGDSTGNSTGHHLHLTVKRVDGNGNVINANDGMGGAVDPLPLITWWDDVIVMSQEEVIKQYVLSFYREPDAGELAFWTGKPLGEFLSTAIKDRAAFLKAHE